MKAYLLSLEDITHKMHNFYTRAMFLLVQVYTSYFGLQAITTGGVTLFLANRCSLYS